jgi:hypothetical protein
MPDALSIVAVAALFLVAILYSRACESLKRPKGGR